MIEELSNKLSLKESEVTDLKEEKNRLKMEFDNEVEQLNSTIR